jgi:hypothetical protein
MPAAKTVSATSRIRRVILSFVSCVWRACIKFDSLRLHRSVENSCENGSHAVADSVVAFGPRPAAKLTAVGYGPPAKMRVCALRTDDVSEQRVNEDLKRGMDPNADFLPGVARDGRLLLTREIANTTLRDAVAKEDAKRQAAKTRSSAM